MLSQRCILPLKVAIALTLAIVSALWLGWDRPYWAGFAVVVMAATETSGHSLKKGRHRLVGTLLGVVSAFVLVGLFAQQPLPFLVCYSLFAALCVYLQGNPRNGYMWTICLMVCSIILVMGKLLPELTFSVAVLRVQETVLGILCFTLVFSLLWPGSSRSVVISTLRLYYQNQAKQLQAAKDELIEHGTFTKELNLGDSLKQLTRLEDLIYAASADSYHVAQDYSKWRSLLDQLNQWALLCGHLAEASSVTQKTMTAEQCKVIEGLLERLIHRANHALSMLEGETIEEVETTGGDVTEAIYDKHVQFSPQQISLLPTISTNVQQGSSEQNHHGASLVLGTLLTDIDRLQHDILATLRSVTGHSYHRDSESNQTPNQTSKRPSRRWSFRPDSAIHALKASLVIWTCIVLWLFVPMPGGAMIVLLGAILSTVVLSLPFANVKTLLFSKFTWSLFVLAQYVLLMPMLTEVWQLAAFYFINTFGIWYLFNQPQQALQRMLGTQLLIMMTSGAMQLTPVYDIQLALLQLMLIGIVMLIVFFINHTVFPGTPESTFLRELGRLRTGIQHGLQQLATLNEQAVSKNKGLTSKLYSLRQDPLRSVAMADVAIGRMNLAAYPELKATEMKRVISNAYITCLMYRAFEDNYLRWLESAHHHALDRLITEILTSLSAILEDSTVSEEITSHQHKLDQLLAELKRYLTGMDRESNLQFTLAAENVDTSYRLLISLQLLIRSLKTLSLSVQNSQVHHLRFQPFAI